MIDYEKLKLAHELVNKLANSKFRISFGSHTDEITFSIDEKWEIIHSIDDLIVKLQELVQPKPKYQIGQDVWVLGLKGGFHKTKIKSIHDGGYMVIGGLDLIYSENELYQTRESLIDEQNEYWNCLKELKDKEYKETTICPQCGEKRVSDGMCWKVGCDYHESMQ